MMIVIFLASPFTLLKKAWPLGPCLFYLFAPRGAVPKLFAGDDSVVGAYTCASAAVDANVGIDYIDVAFRDSAGGAFGQASAASYA